jgi:hypothetical protein
MRRKRALTAGIALVGVVETLFIASPTAAQAATTELDLDLCAPRENTFSLTIDNTYFPLPVGQQWV